MIRAIAGIALFYLGAALSDLSEVIDPQVDPDFNEDTPGWVDSLTDTDLPEE